MQLSVSPINLTVSIMILILLLLLSLDLAFTPPYRRAKLVRYDHRRTGTGCMHGAKRAKKSNANTVYNEISKVLSLLTVYALSGVTGSNHRRRLSPASLPFRTLVARLCQCSNSKPEQSPNGLRLVEGQYTSSRKHRLRHAGNNTYCNCTPPPLAVGRHRQGLRLGAFRTGRSFFSLAI